MSLVETASASLLAPAGLSTTDLGDLLSQCMSPSIDEADLYFQNAWHEAWILEDGIIREGSFNRDQGVGIRAVSGEKTGFAYSDQIVKSALIEAAANARAIARSHQNATAPVIHTGRSFTALYPANNPLNSLTETEKIELLRSVDAAARKVDERVSQVTVSLSGLFENVLVAVSDGTLAADVRPLVRLSVSVIVEHQGRREQGSAGGGGRTDYRYFLEDDRGIGYAQEAVRQALVNLEAVDAPAGTMDVVLGPGWPGVLLHEAVGHGLEGDFNRKGSSAFSGMIGEQVAARGVTVVDDGTMEGRRGSLSVDDEGTPTHCTTLIEDGVLVGYMQDRMNARLMGTQSTGNGRRESYAHLPMPRMTNTYMHAGDKDPGEIIESVERGLYAVNFGGGQVDITSGKFVFSASEAYLIEHGKITSPVKGATLIGNGPDVMRRVSMIGNDLSLDTGVGVCGKEGQSVPVGVGQPTMKIEGLTVGGTQAG
ncbi:MAG: metalloprotease TldD [Thiotrichales bacterium]